MNLLSSPDLDVEEDDLPEPPPSPLEPVPLLSDPEQETDDPDSVEPPASVLEDDDAAAVVDTDDEPDEEEPSGDDLGWAEDSSLEPEPESVAEAETATPWEEDGETGRDPEEETLWDALEDERTAVVGYEELVEVPSLGWSAVLARASSLHEQTELYTRDAVLLAQGLVAVTLRLAGVELSVQVRVVSGDRDEPVLILGRDVLGGRFLVDAGRRRLISPD